MTDVPRRARPGHEQRVRSALASAGVQTARGGTGTARRVDRASGNAQAFVPPDSDALPAATVPFTVAVDGAGSRVAEFVGDVPVLAVKRDSADYPWLVLMSDGSDGLYLGDGTADPTSSPRANLAVDEFTFYLLGQYPNGLTFGRATSQLRLTPSTDTSMYVYMGSDLSVGSYLVVQPMTGQSGYLISAADFHVDPLGVMMTAAFATASRPPTTNLNPGAQVFDTDLGQPIWWNGSAWVDAMGTVV